MQPSAGQRASVAPTLAHRLALTFAGLAALGAVTLLALILPAETAQAELQEQQTLIQVAVVAAQSLDRTMEERYRDVLLARSLGEMHSGTPAQQRRLLEQLQRDSPELAWVGVTDAAGTVRAATGGLLEGADVAGRPWFRQGLAGPSVGDVHPALLLSAMLPRSATGEPLRFVDISAPVLDAAGRVQGVVGAHLSWEWAQGVEEAALELAGRGRGIEMLILNREGVVLHGPETMVGALLPAEEVRRATPGTRGGMSASWGGTRYLAGYAVTGTRSAYPGLGWRVLVRQDAAHVAAQLAVLRQQIGLWGLLGILVSALVAYAAARTVGRPLGALTAAAVGLRGGGTQGLPRLRQYAEVDQLSAALHDLWEGRRAAEAEQAQLTATLEQRVSARTAQLAASNEALDAFTASVSHDLQAPIRHVAGYTSVLRRALAQGDVLKVERAVGTIERAAAQMDAMTNALLEFARTAQEPLTRRRVDVAALAAVARERLTPELEGRDVQWEIGVLPTVLGDAALLQQVMTNLLSNALKYSRHRDVAVIRVTSVTSADEWQVEVHDNGVGFDPDHAGRLFSLFQRLHRHSEFEGTGVGLANVRRVILRHGGRVWARGRPGEGATFGFSLPRAE
ncbi:ATP-binding protein [Deinococcus yunweiensis]|uniref:sensor histidine kinase n=1 Tax=Deinococcus yunweiensis TaxID=367282 RepID=UPI00398F6C2D